MMWIRRPGRYPKLVLGIAMLAFFIWACHLTATEGDGKIEHTFSFTAQADSLSKYDSILILVLDDSSGKVLDTLFRGPVSSKADLRNLKAPHVEGEMVRFLILGYQDGLLTYRVEKLYSTVAGKTESSRVFLLPGISLTPLGDSLRMKDGDSLLFPPVALSPDYLADTALIWSAENAGAGVISVGLTHVYALKPGTTYLKACLKVDSTRNARIFVQVMRKDLGSVPESLIIQPDTLKVAAQGAPGRFSISVFPPGANPGTRWKSMDTAIARISGAGEVRGLIPGRCEVRATSVEDSGISARAWVQVSEPVPVESVLFERDSLVVFVGGAVENLSVKVHPPEANPQVKLVVRDAKFASVAEGKVKGLEAGRTWIVAESAEDSGKRDSLILTVQPAQNVDSVVVKPDTVRLFTGGESRVLKAIVYPTQSDSRVVWSSRTPGVFTVDGMGKVSAVSPGTAQVFATSLADSTRRDSSILIVKRDVPLLVVGRDTSIALGMPMNFNPRVSQEYGLAVLFKWDLDGNGAWDDSAAEVKSLSKQYPEPKEYAARFYVRDSEGNDTVVIKKVQVVKGPVVLILSPVDGAFTNKTDIEVNWSINGNIQTTFTKQALVEGANTIIRTASDTAGNVTTVSITVHLDLTSPEKPKVMGPTPTKDPTPTWTWSGGGGGNGLFRFQLNNESMESVTASRDTSFAPILPLAEGSHTLVVQERDEAGNWSSKGYFTLRIDLTPPAAPKVIVSQPSPTKDTRPSWSWVSGGNGGIGTYRYRMDSSDLERGNTIIQATGFRPDEDLTEGFHTLYIQERDSAGNWSPMGSAGLFIDRTAPAAPVVSVTPSSPTAEQRPTWSWTSGSNGGIGNFRFRLDSSDLSRGATESKSSTFTPDENLTEGPHTLYVQERDSAGNWSSTGSLPVLIDWTPPAVPVVSVSLSSPNNGKRPVWKWMSGGNGGIGIYRYRLDSSDLELKGTTIQATEFGPAEDLGEGLHRLYVQERDSAGNWSLPGSMGIFIDLTAPDAPKVSVLQTSPTNVRRPTWTWASGGNGGMGIYRYRLDSNDLSRDAIEGNSTSFAVAVDLAEGSHTLFVQEKDSAGNWSFSGKAGIVLDLSPPKPPVFSIQPLSPLNSLRPTWSWTSAGSGGAGQFRVKVDDPSLDVGAIMVANNQYLPPGDLPEGAHVLYIQERDSAGNWSPVANKQLVLALRGHVGPGGLSTARAGDPSLALSSDGIPYLAYADYNNISRARVKRFNGTAWEDVGQPAISAEETEVTTLALSSNGIPYLAFSDWDGGASVTVKRYNGAAWEGVGPPRFSEVEPRYISLALTMAGVPYVAYIGRSDDTVFKVKRYNGTAWEDAGPQGVSAGGAAYVSLAMSNSGVPHVAFMDKANGSRATLRRLNGSAWEDVGAPGFSAGAAGYTSLAFNSTGNPYVAFRDGANGNRATVKRFTGSAWEDVGPPGFSAGQAAYISLALSSAGSPHVAYQDEANGNRATVKRFNGTAWVDMGPPGFSPEGADHTCLTLSSTGVPYVAFRGTSINATPAVMKISFDP